MTDESDIDLDSLAASLRADTRDLETYANVLTANLGDVLPPGVVEVDRKRSLADRLAGREGAVTSIRVHFEGQVLELEPVPGRAPRARVVSEVGGVVISRRDVSIDAWAALLARNVAQLAEHSEAARLALARLLGM